MSTKYSCFLILYLVASCTSDPGKINSEKQADSMTNETVKLIAFKLDSPSLFSHKVHAGDLKIDCKSCHQAPSPSNAKPNIQVFSCTDCHLKSRAANQSK